MLSKNFSFKILFIATTILLQSCATILTGVKDPIYFSSYPAGATVKIDGQELGTTPITKKVKRKVFDKPTATISKEGLESKNIVLEQKLNLWTFLLIPTGSIVDALTGSLLRYSKKIYFVDMTNKKDNIAKLCDPDNFCYVVNDKKDTTYIYPEIKAKNKNITYRDINTGKEKKIEKEQVSSYKTITVVRKKIEEEIMERRQVSMKNNNKTELLKLELKNGEYSLFSTAVGSGMVTTVSSGGTIGGQGGGGGIYYYCYKGNELILDKFTRNKNREKVKGYFSAPDAKAYPKNNEKYTEKYNSIF